MLERAQQRLSAINFGHIRALQGDFREIDLLDQTYDVIIAAAVLHHLRDEQDWEDTFKKIHRLTRPLGSVWITDLVSQETDEVQGILREGYSEYLRTIGGDEYACRVFDNIEKEDSPRPVTFQLELLRRIGFGRIKLLHKNSCYAAFGAIKTW